MKAQTLTILGTSSSAGKSLLTTAFCHYFACRGVSVAPFKAQNMSNNAAVCPGGGEIGRAQAVQAAAAGLEPTVDMNPVLIKPEADSRAQVIVRGERWKSLSARDYYPAKDHLWDLVTESLDKLRNQYELVIIEGAGSPVELNLKQNDIVNMAVAAYAQSPVLLVGDIDRGGIFAQLLGTHWLLPPEEQELVQGFIVNKFRGDRRLFEDGIHILEERSGVPVVGVFPYHHQLGVPEEDSVVLESLTPIEHEEGTSLDIAVIHLPRISNFDDFDPLSAEPGVRVRYLKQPGELGSPDAVIIPGTKSTLDDLAWIKDRGFPGPLLRYVEQGGHIVGICGGYQILGEEIRDPKGVESHRKKAKGLGLLPIQTTFRERKATYQSRARISGGDGWMTDLQGALISGYEIHIGRTRGETGWLTIEERAGSSVEVPDGAVSLGGRTWGCYLHGLFANREFRKAWLAALGSEPASQDADNGDLFSRSLKRLRTSLDRTLDMEYVERVIWER